MYGSVPDHGAWLDECGDWLEPSEGVRREPRPDLGRDGAGGGGVSVGTRNVIKQVLTSESCRDVFASPDDPRDIAEIIDDIVGGRSNVARVQFVDGGETAPAGTCCRGFINEDGSSGLLITINSAYWNDPAGHPQGVAIMAVVSALSGQIPALQAGFNFGQLRALTLLHEIGHALYQSRLGTGIRPDLSNELTSLDNDINILRGCFSW